MNTVLIDGVEYREVLSPKNSCTVDGIWCGYKRRGDPATQYCKHPEAGNPGQPYCAQPDRMFVLPEEAPIFVKARLKA